MSADPTTDGLWVKRTPSGWYVARRRPDSPFSETLAGPYPRSSDAEAALAVIRSRGALPC